MADDGRRVKKSIGILALAIRANAELISDPYEKRALRLIAQRYDILADHAAKRADGIIDDVEKSA